jgi:hypothetical protein
MVLPEDVEEILAENEVFLLEPRDDYDACIIGIGERFSSGLIAVYSTQKVIKVLKEQGMDEEEAHEFFEFNVIGSWMGDGTPMFIHLFDG